MKTNKQKNKTVQLELDEQHLYTLVYALEVYSRLKTGQIGMAIDTAFQDKLIGWDDKQMIETVVRNVVFKGEELVRNPNMSYGIHQKEVGDAKQAFIIRKVIDQYFHYKRNDGYRIVCDVSGDGAPYIQTDIPIPKIVGFEPKKTFKIPKRAYDILNKAFDKKDWKTMWAAVDLVFKKNPLPKGSSSEIKKIDNEWVVIVNEPYKLNSI